jgi:hypothetical protein
VVTEWRFQFSVPCHMAKSGTARYGFGAGTGALPRTRERDDHWREPDAACGRRPAECWRSESMRAYDEMPRMTMCVTLKNGFFEQAVMLGFARIFPGMNLSLTLFLPTAASSVRLQYHLDVFYMP